MLNGKGARINSREDAINWIIDNQLGRRNITPEQRYYLLGKRYKGEKKVQGGTGANQYKEQSTQNEHSAKTSEKIAIQNNVSRETVFPITSEL